MIFLRHSKHLYKNYFQNIFIELVPKCTKRNNILKGGTTNEHSRSNEASDGERNKYRRENQDVYGILPTNLQRYQCLVVSRHYKKKQTAGGRWQPSADDLIADDWILDY